MAFKEYKQLSLTNLSKEILAFWGEKEIFKKSISSRKNSPSFVFYEGPPSANGTPGIHHVMARTIKDIFCRYKTQKGYKVERKAGWDTHGLPVELGVEKELGITKKLRASNLLSHYENVKSVLGNNYWFGTSSYNPQNDEYYKKLITRLNN